MNKWLSALTKEWLEAIRDKRSIMTALIIPFFMPLLMGGVLTFIIDKQTKTQYNIAITGAENLAPLIQQLDRSNAEYTLVESVASIDVLLEEYDAVIAFDKAFEDDFNNLAAAHVLVWSNSSNTKSRSAGGFVRANLSKVSATIASQRMLARGVPTQLQAPLSIVVKDTAVPGSRAAMILGSMPGMIIFVAFACALATAIDTTSGERERLSLEPLLVQPMSTFGIMTSKWVVVSVFGWMGSMITVLVLNVVMSYVPLHEFGISWNIAWEQLAVIALQLLPVAMLAAALMLLVALAAKTFKEAQTLLGILQVLPLVGLMAIDMSEKEMTGIWLSIPFISQQQFIKSHLTASSVDTIWMAVGTLITILIAFFVIHLAARKLNNPHGLLSN